MLSLSKSKKVPKAVSIILTEFLQQQFYIYQSSSGLFTVSVIYFFKRNNRKVGISGFRDQTGRPKTEIVGLSGGQRKISRKISDLVGPRGISLIALGPEIPT